MSSGKKGNLSERSCIEDWPPFRFRPYLFSHEDRWGEDVSPYSLLTSGDRRPVDVWRYDEARGEMVPDDGQPALSFTVVGAEAIWVLVFTVPERDNLLRAWHDEDMVRHVITRNGDLGDGQWYRDHRKHPNSVAAQTAEEFFEEFRDTYKEQYSWNPIVFELDPLAAGYSRYLELIGEFPIKDCVRCKWNSYGHRMIKWKADLFLWQDFLNSEESRVNHMPTELADREAAIDKLKRAIDAMIADPPTKG